MMPTPIEDVGVPDRSWAIDALRGLAIMMVVLCHLPFSTQVQLGGWALYPPEKISALLWEGHYGVQLFLVISGFCIHLRWARARRGSARVNFWAFWKRRFIRLYPAYLVALCITILLSFWVGGGYYKTVNEFGFDLIVLLTQTQNFTDASLRIGNGVFWSLALEEQLYLLYFPLLAMRKRWGWTRTLAIVFVVNSLWLVLAAYIPREWVSGWSRAALAYWFPWALGALAVEAWTSQLELPRWTRSLWSVLGCLLLALAVPSHFRSFVIAVSFFFVMRFVVEKEREGLSRPGWIQPLLRLGLISYSVYLIHLPVFTVVSRWLLPLGLPPELVFVLRFLSGIVAGYILFRFVEKRSLRYFQSERK